MRVTYSMLLLSTICGLLAFTTSGFKLPDNIGKPSHWCINKPTLEECNIRSDCVWCEKPQSKVGTGCYPISTAKLLPKAWGVQCSKDLDPSASASSLGEGARSQQGLQQSACDGKPEAACVAPQCVWCTSAAVGGGCYTPDEAKLLPKAIFKCKTQVAGSGVAVA